MSDRVSAILEDTKERLKKELPGIEFFFLLMPVDRDRMYLMGEEARNQVQIRMVKHLQREINEAIVDQRREI